MNFFKNSVFKKIKKKKKRVKKVKKVKFKKFFKKMKNEYSPTMGFSSTSRAIKSNETSVALRLDMIAPFLPQKSTSKAIKARNMKFTHILPYKHILKHISKNISKNILKYISKNISTNSVLSISHSYITPLLYSHITSNITSNITSKLYFCYIFSDPKSP